MSGWLVYIILTENDKLYTGITNDLSRRFEEHQNQKKGARYFHLGKPKQVVFKESHADRSSASKREWQIKKMTRLKKLALINAE